MVVLKTRRKLPISVGSSSRALDVMLESARVRRRVFSRAYARSPRRVRTLRLRRLAADREMEMRWSLYSFVFTYTLARSVYAGFIQASSDGCSSSEFVTFRKQAVRGRCADRLRRRLHHNNYIIRDKASVKDPVQPNLQTCGSVFFPLLCTQVRGGRVIRRF